MYERLGTSDNLKKRILTECLHSTQSQSSPLGDVEWAREGGGVAWERRGGNGKTHETAVAIIFVTQVITARKQSLRRLCFYMGLSVILFMGGGVCMVAGGHVWLLGGMHGCQGACMVAEGCVWLWGGHAWLLGEACVVARGMHGCWGHAWLQGGHAWLQGGLCMVAGGMSGCSGGACVGYDEIRSMSGRYASYWNAFLFLIKIHFNIINGKVASIRHP